MERRHALLFLVPRIAHALAHAVALHQVFRQGLQQGLEVFCFRLRAEPGGVVGRLQDHRHAVVHRAHQCIGVGGDEGGGLQRRAVRRLPVFPQAGEGEQPLALQADEPRLLARGRGLPFVEAVGGDEAAHAAEGAAEGRLLGHRLAARVGELRRHRGVLRPGGQQAPLDVHRLQPGLGLLPAMAHDEDRLCGRDVVARRGLGHGVDAEVAGDVGRRGLEGEASAHGGFLFPLPRPLSRKRERGD